MRLAGGLAAGVVVAGACRFITTHGCAVIGTMVLAALIVLLSGKSVASRTKYGTCGGSSGATIWSCRDHA